MGAAAPPHQKKKRGKEREKNRKKEEREKIQKEDRLQKEIQLIISLRWLSKSPLQYPC